MIASITKTPLAPNFGATRAMATGISTDPIPDPELAIPIAKLLLSLKKKAQLVIEGRYMKPVPVPIKKPYITMKTTKLFVRLQTNIEAADKPHPASAVHLRPILFATIATKGDIN